MNPVYLIDNSEQRGRQILERWSEEKELDGRKKTKRQLKIEFLLRDYPVEEIALWTITNYKEEFIEAHKEEFEFYVQAYIYENGFKHKEGNCHRCKLRILEDI